MTPEDALIVGFGYGMLVGILGTLFVVAVGSRRALSQKEDKQEKE